MRINQPVMCSAAGKFFAVLVLVGLTGVTVAIAQTTGKGPRFEVASIRRCENEAQGTSSVSPGYLEPGCQPLIDIIRSAYVFYAGGHFHLSNISRTPISGGPSWIKSDLYAIKAKPDAVQTMAMMLGPMMQALLEERFHLRVHTEQRMVAGYRLVIGKAGHRLRPFETDQCVKADFDQGPPPALPVGQSYCGVQRRPRNGPALVAEIWGYSLDDFANWLFSIVHQPVVNQTGLAGQFDYRLEYAPEPRPTPDAQGAPANPDNRPVPADDPGEHPSIFSAIEQQLGLSLVPAKVQQDILIIDSVDRPSEN